MKTYIVVTFTELADEQNAFGRGGLFRLSETTGPRTGNIPPRGN
ncbi:hypothetical protein [Hyphomonas polymorpha]|nr:hypothetical protein [Hyphomonas polymorpha]